MVSRCHNKNDKSFRYYGGRGIAVCAEWRGRGGYDAFCRYLTTTIGPRPRTYQIDRIDNTRGYERGNIKWSTAKENSNNRRSNRSVTVKGVTRTAAEWAARVGVRSQIITNRLTAGWSPYDAVMRPVTPAPPKITYRGEEVSVRDGAREAGMSRSAFAARLHRGMSVEEAIRQPPHGQPELTTLLLSTLRERVEVRPYALARELRRDPATVNTMLSLMARGGMIVRVRRGVYRAKQALLAQWIEQSFPER